MISVVRPPVSRIGKSRISPIALRSCNPNMFQPHRHDGLPIGVVDDLELVLGGGGTIGRHRRFLHDLQCLEIEPVGRKRCCRLRADRDSIYFLS